jgi:hypothetical protein
MVAGSVMVGRTKDKAVASNEGTLGEYHYNCPMDKKMFEFFGVSAEVFAEKVKELGTDEKVGGWLDAEHSKTKEEKDSFNNKMRHIVPDTDDSKAWMKKQQEGLGRSDYTTYFDNIDADEKRF